MVKPTLAIHLPYHVTRTQLAWLLLGYTCLSTHSLTHSLACSSIRVEPRQNLHSPSPLCTLHSASLQPTSTHSRDRTMAFLHTPTIIIAHHPSQSLDICHTILCLTIRCALPYVVVAAIVINQYITHYSCHSNELINYLSLYAGRLSVVQ